MAYEALVSLNLMIQSFLNIRHRNTYLRHIQETAEKVHEEVWSLKSILELHHFKEGERLIAFKGEILEAIPKFRDLLQDLINKFQDKSSYELIFSPYLVNKEMISFVETMKKINKEYNAKLDLETSNKESPLADEDFGGNAKDTVGVYDEDLRQLIHKLTRKSSDLSVVSVAGMAGIGKTTIVKIVYNDPVISDYFHTRAFVRVGPDYHLKDILLGVLVCLSPDYNKILGMEKSVKELKEEIYKFLSDRRYLIVLDDVWDEDFCIDMLWCMPNDDMGSKIIFTTRLLSLASKGDLDDILVISLRNEEESWNLFCRKIFIEDSCPPGLEKVGKKIVKNCGGLPLGIISIANILSKAEKTLDYWEKVAENENLLALATKEGSHMAESLFLSYKHLPPHLKECCLYFGVFPLNHLISVSKLVKLWVSEGLVEPKHFKTFENTARTYLKDLAFHNIILVKESFDYRIKTCRAHYFFWHLLVREAANKKIFHLINRYSSAFSEDIHCQRRLCIHKNALLGFKRVSESIESVSNVRSFLCTGPEHHYPVSICSGLTSIKVLDVLTIRLYKFPVGILELVELKYLAFTYDGKLPSSISRLKNLVYLIVHRYHLTIINSSPSYMPKEIWNMQELRHLQVMGSDLPHPFYYGAQLPNLVTLLGVSDRSCTIEIFQSIPNLKKLGVRIGLGQGVSETLHIFDHLALLSKLKSFKCVVSNPNPRSHQVLLLPKAVFPSSLKKLTLSGCGFAWEDMSMIGRALPNLRVLKLRCYAFQGPEWMVNMGEFPKLQYLLLEDTDLVHWKVGYCSFPVLNCLIIRHCYKLEKIPRELENSFPNVELVDCSPSVIASAKLLQEEECLEVQIYSSLDEEKHYHHWHHS